MPEVNLPSGFTPDDKRLVESTLRKIESSLLGQLRSGDIREEIYRSAHEEIPRNLLAWLSDERTNSLSPNLRSGILEAMRQDRIEHLKVAFIHETHFGTSGIREKMALQDRELLVLNEQGIDAPVLKGPNTMNDVVFLKTSAGVARYAAEQGLSRLLVGYDTRVRGSDFAHLIARLFLAYGLTVYLFDEPCPFPEVTFAVPTLKADLGILISASHNDRRYNGYKICNASGSALGLNQRNLIHDGYISKVTTADIKLIDFEKAPEGRLVFLGGSSPLPGVEYYGRKLLNMHRRHVDHIRKFVLMDSIALKQAAKGVKVAYCAYHGAGRKAVPRLLRSFGFAGTKIVHRLHNPDGLFPAFDRHPEQQPDPGDPDAAEIALSNFEREYPGVLAKHGIDVMVGTDPDADRAGIVVRIPEGQEHVYQDKSYPSLGDYTLLSADEAWAILLWYRLSAEARANGGVLPEAGRKFIALSHVTTDLLTQVARKYGLGVVKTWVGFAMIADAVNRLWLGEQLSRESHPNLIYEAFGMEGNRRDANVGAFEQSNGFSIFGARPKTENALGIGGHVRDKDGTMAAMLLAEVAAWAKSQGTSLLQLLDEKLYLDPDIGCFITYYEAAPRYGEYEDLKGIADKIKVLDEADRFAADVRKGLDRRLGGLKVVAAERYRTGKYDKQHWKKGPPADEGFPDEGVRFFFSRDRLSHFTLRPSGTSQSLRLHVQLKVSDVTRANLVDKKAEARRQARAVVKDVRSLFHVRT